MPHGPSKHLLTVRCATGTGPYGPLCRYLAHRLGGRTRDQHAALTVVGRCTAHLGIVSLVPTAIPSSHAKAERRHLLFKGERKRSECPSEALMCLLVCSGVNESIGQTLRITRTPVRCTCSARGHHTAPTPSPPPTRAAMSCGRSAHHAHSALAWLCRGVGCEISSVRGSGM